VRLLQALRRNAHRLAVHGGLAQDRANRNKTAKVIFRQIDSVRPNPVAAGLGRQSQDPSHIKIGSHIEASRRRCTATLRAMIICSCNVLSDDDVRVAVTSIRQQPCTPGRIYGCLGCSVRCGRCARSVQRVVDDALAACRARGAARPSPANLEPAFSHVEVVPTINGPQKPLIGFSSKKAE
jgi:bacterioferritin-associated ferredoxin